MVATGTIVRFDEIRGYGFVSPDAGGEDVFIHVNDLDFDKHLLMPGVRVDFVAEEGERGPKASHVKLLDQPKSAAVRPARVAESPRPRAFDGTADRTVDAEGELCDVLSRDELITEFTERLLSGVPSLTGEQILAVRQCVVAVARDHGWIDDTIQ